MVKMSKLKYPNKKSHNVLSLTRVLQGYTLLFPSLFALEFFYPSSADPHKYCYHITPFPSPQTTPLPPHHCNMPNYIPPIEIILKPKFSLITATKNVI